MARVECYCNGILGGLSWARWRYWRARELRWIRAVLCFTVRGKRLKIKHLPPWKVAGRSWHDARRELLRARGWTLSDSSRVTLDVFRRTATLGEATNNRNWRRRSCCSSFRKPGHALKWSTSGVQEWAEFPVFAHEHHEEFAERGAERCDQSAEKHWVAPNN